MEALNAFCMLLVECTTTKNTNPANNLMEMWGRRNARGHQRVQAVENKLRAWKPNQGLREHRKLDYNQSL
jgi:hypothetical protein